MNAYIYAAALYCDDCGKAIRVDLTAAGKAPADPEDEASYDSDAFPKGPFADGGGEADCPQHCDSCGLFLENPLTDEGYTYVKEAIERHIHDPKDGNVEVLREWADLYDLAWPEIGGMYFDRFDVCLAYMVYMNHYHGGQGSKEYRLTGVFHKLQYEPQASYTDDPWELDENARGIYWALVSGATSIRDRR